MLPRLALTLGDPAGIGPEVVLKALGDRPWMAQAEITVVGSAAVWDRTQRHLGLKDSQAGVKFLDVPLESTAWDWGVESAESGAASFAFLKTAIAKTVAGEFDAIVTAPIAKSAWKKAGHFYPGQTELLAEGARTDRFGMAFVARSPHTGWMLRALLATTHIPLTAVPQALTPAVMDLKLGLLLEALEQDFGIRRPRIAIAGLNPHSGEGGQLGTEEQEWLIPWLTSQRQRYPHAQLDGPIPPDTMWVSPAQAWYGQRPVVAHDAYLALYHDQGLIPVKLMGFERAVNTTLGLPFIRTSPDHGTAFDIAGKGVAEATSLIAAIELAIDLVIHRRLASEERSRRRGPIPQGLEI
ncbi:4-hydroxythreonine-4-phosphate dehydrogenase PdxA [filamentous cyanobacterium CCP5]|nr:4-hydroxythreonine-4-phosphate dehydrogenase PdxA [filamentous cyanobacterium CCP5]